MSLWQFWRQCFKWAYKEWEGKEPLMAYPIIIISTGLALTGIVLTASMQTAIYLLALIPLFITIGVFAPHRLYINTQNDLQSKMEDVSHRLEFLEKERIPHISVDVRGGHRSDNWEHEHLMWAELDVRNTSSSLPLNDVEVKVVNLLDIVEKQDEPGKYILFSLHKWNPIQIYWSERNAPAMQLKRDIPPNDVRTALIAFSDNSNGPPAVINTPTTSKPLLFSLGHKMDIEVSSPNSAIWKGEFYIECHGKYVMKEFPYCTEATFEFEAWDKWLSKK